jgi:hypothetical protein
MLSTADISKEKFLWQNSFFFFSWISHSNLYDADAFSFLGHSMRGEWTDLTQKKAKTNKLYSL